MLSIQPDNPDSQDLDIERPGDLKADLSRADHEHAYKLDIHWLVPGPYLLQGHEA